MRRLDRRVSPILLGILVVVSAGCVPNARLAGNEASAIASLRLLAAAQVRYSATCGQNAYAAAFPTLAAVPDMSGPLLSPDLSGSATPEKAGYRFTLSAGAGATPGPPDCHGKTTVTDWYATATPITWGSTGRRSFATSATNTIWELDGPTAPTEPFGPPAKPVQ